jgi:hypothetical protein
MSFRQLFITGTARGGTSLVGRFADAHHDVNIAIDAYLPLFRAGHNAIRGSWSRRNGVEFDPTQPLHDGHFGALNTGWLDAMINGSLDHVIDPSELQHLHSALQRRASDEAVDLVPYLTELDGTTIQDVIAKSLDLIAEVRRAKAGGWIGVKDLWIIDQFPALARAFPDGRFVLVLRDPRAVIASILGYLLIDPTQCAHVLSVLRHWRKGAACACHFRSHPDLEGRFLVLKYEELVADPAASAYELCEFLELEVDPAMVDFAGYLGHGTGKPWRGNSTFESSLSTISDVPVERWRQSLSEDVIALIELACAPDMAPWDYASEKEPLALPSDPGGLQFLMSDHKRNSSWRCDFQDPIRDYGCEMFRQSLLALETPCEDLPLLRSAFLFPEYYTWLRKTNQA